MSIAHFVHQLVEAETPPNCTNPYDKTSEANAMRRQNLRLYLEEMAKRRPCFLLIGEAPGYRGCRQTGIPFVSPAILREGVTEFNLFGREQGYGETAVSHEATATLVWQTLRQLKVLPLLWNIFPFHPYKDGRYQSNRTPTKQEIAAGEPFVTHLITLFDQPTLIAVGQKAHLALNQWKMPHQRARHPSHGGKQQFIEDLNDHLADGRKNRKISRFLQCNDI